MPKGWTPLIDPGSWKERMDFEVRKASVKSQVSFSLSLIFLVYSIDIVIKMPHQCVSVESTKNIYAYPHTWTSHMHLINGNSHDVISSL